MQHRTRTTQQDEALRQARHDDTIRQGLRLIADTLTHHQPNGLIDATHRLHLARTTAEATHPTAPDAVNELEQQLLRRMPFVDGKAVTRGEYALWLHKKSWGA